MNFAPRCFLLKCTVIIWHSVCDRENTYKFIVPVLIFLFPTEPPLISVPNSVTYPWPIDSKTVLELVYIASQLDLRNSYAPFMSDRSIFIWMLYIDLDRLHKWLWLDSIRIKENSRVCGVACATLFRMWKNNEKHIHGQHARNEQQFGLGR